ncbi:MAG: hypothetical protein M9900_14775 [Flavobacteriales bacterium]|nr:hypothetical protein [Flavobacteriales bacterium]
MKTAMTMRTFILPFLVLALPCAGQQAVTTKTAQTACLFQPVSQETNGERIRVAWAAPKCVPAAVRVFRRRQHVGTEAEIHPVIVQGTRNDTTTVICWDTLFTELGIYEYRLMPMDTAGREGPSSPWVSANNLNAEARPWFKYIRADDVPGTRGIRLSWRLEHAVRTRGIAIYRADRFEGPYLHLADVPVLDTIFMDRVQRVKETYFYRLEAIDVVGTSTMSMPVQGVCDYAPPVASPAWLQAENGPSGIRLYWPGGDPDVLEYNVERGTPADTGFVMVAAGIRPRAGAGPQWTDSSVTDNRVLRYRVRAVGIGGTISGPSPVAGVQALDERIPASPTDVAVRRTDRAVIVSWREPWSGDRGISWTQVERATADGSDFNPVTKQALEPGILAYIDSTAMPGLAYRYRVVGVALSGMRGVPSQAVALDAGPMGADAPRLLTATRTKDGISLSWAGRERHGLGFKLYRSVDGGEPKLLKDLPVNVEGYTDTAPVRGALNLYLLRMVLPDGTESTPSEPVGMRW